MGLRFRQSFQLFPGVRLNLGGGGISATIGVPGASVNLGGRGVRSTVGIPGSGISYTSNLTPRVSPSPAPNPGSAPSFDHTVAHWQSQEMREINSAAVESLTSHGLVEVRELIDIATEALGRDRLRTALSVLGIVLGVAAVIAMTAES